MSHRAVSSTYHQTRFVYDPARAPVWRSICGYLQRFVREDSGLLEVGAGYGDFCRFIRAAPKWSVDANAEMMQHWSKDVTPIVQSLPGPLPLASGTIGTVVASNFLEHFTIESCREILAELRRVMRPDGRLIVIQPNFRLQPYRYFDDYTHKTPFTDDGFTDFLRSLGWRIVHREARFLPFSMRSRLPKWGWLVSLYLALPYRPNAGQFLVVAAPPNGTSCPDASD